MKILITGIAGQLGNRLSELLVERGISHKGISRSNSYVPNEGVLYYDTDLSDINPSHLKLWLSDVTHVIHFADVINENLDRERKEDLFKKKVEELKTVFKTNTLTDLEKLEIDIVEDELEARPGYTQIDD